jgi:hypothetical protein
MGSTVRSKKMAVSEPSRPAAMAAAQESCPALCRGPRGDKPLLAEAVILRESGVSSTPRPIDSIIDASEYWIARWRLSSDGAMRRPGGGR